MKEKKAHIMEDKKERIDGIVAEFDERVRKEVQGYAK